MHIIPQMLINLQINNSTVDQFIGPECSVHNCHGNISNEKAKY